MELRAGLTDSSRAVVEGRMEELGLGVIVKIAHVLPPSEVARWNH